MTKAERIARANKRTLISKIEDNRKAVSIEVPLIDYFSSVLAPLSGELPKAEGEAQAVYFAMNTASEPSAIRS